MLLYILNKRSVTFWAYFGMIGLSKIKYFSDHIFDNFDVEWFQVQVSDLVVNEMPHSIDDVQ